MILRGEWIGREPLGNYCRRVVGSLEEGETGKMERREELHQGKYTKGSYS